MMRRYKRLGCGLAVLPLSVAAAGRSGAADWRRFRGPGGSGTSDETSLSTAWSDSKGIEWKAPLPGPGSSSPIVCGDRVFVTCYTGYGVDPSSPGSQAELKRHVICVNRKDGKIVWSKSVQAVLPEDPFRGHITDHVRHQRFQRHARDQRRADIPAVQPGPLLYWKVEMIGARR